MADVLTQLRALLAKATPGPWKHARIGGGRVIREAVFGAPRGPHVCTVPNDRPLLEREADAALIVAAVNALPAILDALKYATHTRDCKWVEQPSGPPVYHVGLDCTCGLDAALGSLERAALGAPPAPGEGGRHDGGGPPHADDLLRYHHAEQRRELERQQRGAR